MENQKGNPGNGSRSNNVNGGSSARGGSSRGSGGNSSVTIQTSSGTVRTHASSAKLVNDLAWDMAKASTPNYHDRQHLAEHFARKFWDD
ncbi:hypothetical protein V9T40_002645 [Parthenolecanium corni]|uniref:Uncharacterized protein n=1 Tax=Parthenolecanium corni TaxID=536013 RepID=A0AAN9Y4N6_9HEMI